MSRVPLSAGGSYSANERHYPALLSWRWMSRASLPGIPGTASSSSRDAATRRSGEPKCSSSARLRFGPTPRQLVEQRAGHRLVATAAVVVEREPVRLVADPLQQPQGLGVAVDRDRVRRGPGRRPPRAASRARSPPCRARPAAPSDPHPGRELALAAVDHDQVGDRGEALVALGVVGRAVGLLEQLRRPGAPAPPPSTRSRPGPADAVAPDPEPAVIGLPRRAPLKTTIEATVCSPTEVRDVEALDPHRQRFEAERVLQRRQRVDPLGAAALLAGAGPGRARATALRSASSRSRRFVAALGDPDLDRAAAPRRERLGDQARRARAAPGRRRRAAGPRAPPSSTGRGTPRSPRPRRARPRWRGRSRGARRAPRRAPGRPARWPPRPRPRPRPGRRSSSDSPATAAPLHQRAHRLEPVAVDRGALELLGSPAASAILRSRSRSTSR